MIDPAQLTDADIGRKVIYHPEYGKTESGELTSWTDTTVFARFKGPTGEGCKPEDLSFAAEPRALKGAQPEQQ